MIEMVQESVSVGSGTLPMLRGEKLLKAALNQIISHPETWEQEHWHSKCGTRHCIAGWCQILAGRKADESTALEQAMYDLDLSIPEAEFLFSPMCCLPQAYFFAEHFNDPCRLNLASSNYRSAGPLKPFSIE